MADQKRWFKVWGSLTQDPSFLSLTLEDVGRWVLLGAWVATHGTRGILVAPESAIRHVLRVPENVTIACALALPNVSFEEGKNRHGWFAVTLNKWTKYQEDSTQAERQKTSRAKRRREEKRGEEKRKELKDSSRDAKKPASSAALSRDFFESLGTNPAYGGIDLDREAEKMRAWCGVNRKLPSRRRFVNWLNRIEVVGGDIGGSRSGLLAMTPEEEREFERLRTAAPGGGRV